MSSLNCWTSFLRGGHLVEGGRRAVGQPVRRPRINAGGLGAASGGKRNQGERQSGHCGNLPRISVNLGQRRAVRVRRALDSSAGTRAGALNSQNPLPKPELGIMPDWKSVLRTVFVSRALDALEETRLVPERKVLYQFCARGHDVTQVLLGQRLTGRRDAVTPYYRSRPLALTLGVSAEEALASTMMRAEGMSGGRDVGVVINRPNRDGPCLLPACGGVGTQYTPATGWAQALRYRARVLGDPPLPDALQWPMAARRRRSTNGFWASLNIATTERLPLLYFIEDNGYGISVPSRRQTPGGDIAANLAAFGNLRILAGEGSDPVARRGADRLRGGCVRAGDGPVLLRLRVPRLSGHSAQDTQAYKSAEEIESERARDPLLALRRLLVPAQVSRGRLAGARGRGGADRRGGARSASKSRPPVSAATVARYAFTERRADGSPELQAQGGQWADGATPPAGDATPRPEGARINMLTAIRRTLEHELAVNPRVLVFGEDVGRKGGVHAATLGLQERFGEDRVFDTSLSEEGIIGRAVGMALAGLVPVPEIQFRKYAEPAAEQLHDCGTIRWRTVNRFAAPMVVRMPGGFFKCGDPWHSQCNEVQFLHAVGWQLAMPSNAEDAVGLLRTALRGNEPVIFFEHRFLLDGAAGRRPWPGDDFVLPFGKANRVREGIGAHRGHLGRDGRALRTGGGGIRDRRRAPRPQDPVPLGPGGGARIGRAGRAVA